METAKFKVGDIDKYTIVIWIEGNDPECDDDVQDAHISVQLGFVGCDKDNKPIS